MLHKFPESFHIQEANPLIFYWETAAAYKKMLICK